jgi:hypothetical protein
LEGRFKGIIEHELRGRGFHSEGYNGRLSMVQHEGEDPIQLEYQVEDFDKKFILKRGDYVEFSIAVDNRSKIRRATNIVPCKETGNITAIKKDHGIIISENRKDEITYELSDVRKIHKFLIFCRFQREILVTEWNIHGYTIQGKRKHKLMNQQFFQMIQNNDQQYTRWKKTPLRY